MCDNKSDCKEKSISDISGEILEAVCLMSQDLIKKKQRMINVILEKTDATSRLRCLKLILLEEQSKHNSESMGTLMPDLLGNVGFNNLTEMTSVFDIVFAPAVAYGKLIGSIGNVIRSEGLSDEERINKIIDLLV